MKILIILFCFLFVGLPDVSMSAKTPPNWRDWPTHPKGDIAPRMTASQVREIFLSGEKMVFVYAGYLTESVVCSSIFLPYNAVPPFGNGARVNLDLPKDTWMVAY
ncbi:hypothetical protein [Geoalkalibacter halelectricus]|uniref:Uncharacterized protein n=1 Tax=Geoalkalibacter halelectricus TaxID=2847045 RepID=A0ABY5ZJF0_9BACT|nr:hypothetical protein [Geoalkalibacter halelectricus]MDO3379726.1 hypothetical protein [Geoalkalibacter halelectricus]UWZ79260.1 hypothetical protein L9S41_16495 [Geoalkalibacter halelectricus]